MIDSRVPSRERDITPTAGLRDRRSYTSDQLAEKSLQVCPMLWPIHLVSSADHQIHAVLQQYHVISPQRYLLKKIIHCQTDKLNVRTNTYSGIANGRITCVNLFGYETERPIIYMQEYVPGMGEEPMNGRERIALMMQHRFPDRIPVMCQLALGHYFLNTDIEPHAIWFTSEGFAEALIQLQKRYRFDGILVNLWGMPSHILEAVVSLKTISNEELLVWENGEMTVIPPDDNAQHYLADKQPLERADLETIDLDNLDTINTIKGYFWNIYHMPYIPEVTESFLPGEIPDYFFNTIDIVRSRVEKDISVHGEVYSPFTHFIELLGYEQALMGLLTDPDRAHILLEYLTGVSVSHAVALGNHGVDAVLISSAFAGGPFLSRDMYKEFVLPYEREVTDAVKSTGTTVYTHTCGCIGDRLDLMIETGTMGIDTLDPPPLGNTDLKTALEELDGRVFVKGNMNPVELLGFMTEEEVIAHATDRITIGKPKGAYILSTACSVAPRTEPWKLELLTPLAERLGVY